MCRVYTVCALWLPIVTCVGCARESKAVSVDPDVRRTVDQFWQSVIEPDLDPATGRPVLNNAYQQLHRDAKRRQTVKAFGDECIKWIQEQGVGWVLSAQIQSAETTSDSVIVVVKLSVGDPTGLDPSSRNQEALRRMTLRKEGSGWAVFSVEEETSSEQTD